MIKAKDGIVEIRKTNLAEMLADYTNITKSVIGALTERFGMSKEEAHKKIDFTIELAKMSKDELAQRMLETVKNHLDSIFAKIMEEEEHE